MTHRFSQMLRQLADILDRNPDMPWPDITDDDGIVFRPVEQRQMNAVVDGFGDDWGHGPRYTSAVLQGQWIATWSRPEPWGPEMYSVLIEFDPRELQIRPAVRTS